MELTNTAIPSRNTFHRIERKYIITKEQFEYIADTVSGYLDPDTNAGSDGMYSIMSLYYDTPYNTLIRASQTKPKPKYKEKLRIRSYETPGLDDFVYIEIKKKVDGIGNKRRCKMTLSEAYEFLKTGNWVNVTNRRYPQVLDEIGAMIKRHGNVLVPAAILSYDRFAFNGTGDLAGMRVSFDKNFLGRTYDLRMEKGRYGEQLLDQELMIMEIKVISSLPIWLTHVLSSQRVFPRSYSKYGTFYLSELARQNENSVLLDFEEDNGPLPAAGCGIKS
ncbi:MAG: polyphosphate polymerase domain-containing protein [Oscillospiraceae bacterium]|nr:polyphosphate polymerase domain-containing protein [Oscillospiraceae bacterium]